jgi:hypothetical protein
MLIFNLSARMSATTFFPAILLAGLIFVQPVSSQTRPAIQQFPELVPLPSSQQLSTMREPLPVETIADAALEFSGASDAGAAGAKDKLVGLLRRFRDEVAEVTEQAALAEKALLFLHKNLLTTYAVLQTRVDTALETGVFNCVSSAVLYMIVAQSVGLSVSGVRTTDHAFCSVLVNGRQVDVETTNPDGFNPGAKKEFTDSFGKVTGFRYVPPGNYGDRRPIGEKELLSLILYNRVSEYGDSRFFKDALQPAVSAYALIGSDEMRGVMGIAFANYVTSLGVRQDYSQAVQFMDAVKASFGGIVDLSQPRRDMYHNWVVSLIDANSILDADTLLSQPGTKAALDDADWTNLSVVVIQQRAQAEAEMGGYLAAAGVVTDAMSRLGRIQPLLQTYEAYMHNAFAQLFNAKKLANAKAVLDQGIAAYPESRYFQQDLELLKKAQRQ